MTNKLEQYKINVEALKNALHGDKIIEVSYIDNQDNTIKTIKSRQHIYIPNMVLVFLRSDLKNNLIELIQIKTTNKTYHIKDGL